MRKVLLESDFTCACVCVYCIYCLLLCCCGLCVFMRAFFCNVYLFDFCVVSCVCVMFVVCVYGAVPFVCVCSVLCY